MRGNLIFHIFSFVNYRRFVNDHGLQRSDFAVILGESKFH